MSIISIVDKNRSLSIVSILIKYRKSIKVDQSIHCDYRLVLIDFDRLQSTSIGKTKQMCLAGKKGTVAEYRLIKQHWLCQDFILPLLYSN